VRKGRGAAYHRNGFCHPGLEVDQPVEQLNTGPDAQIRLTKGCKCGQYHHRVHPNVMRLQVKVVQELVHEAAGGQREAPGEMVIEDHQLPRPRIRDLFTAGGTVAHEVRGWKHSTPAQQLDLFLLHP
jgi:hypothetical protein